jgi:formate dehydrogenase subunit gamma
MSMIQATTPEAELALEICQRHNNQASELLEILHDFQHAHGFVPETAIPTIAKAINRSRAEVHGVVTFYHDYRREKPGRYIVKICRAEACQSMGAEKTCDHAEHKLKTKLGGTSADGKVTVEGVFCLGNCALSPAVMIDDTLHGRVSPERFDELMAELGKVAAE